jgi:hypothetical protein
MDPRMNLGFLCTALRSEVSETDSDWYCPLISALSVLLLDIPVGLAGRTCRPIAWFYRGWHLIISQALEVKFPSASSPPLLSLD